MNFKKMYKMQKELDERIRMEHHLQDVDVINEKVLAFQVELGELANETRCFKYWSLKPPSDNETILEEYVDGIHFLLSLGLDMEITFNHDGEIIRATDLTNQFGKIFELSSLFAKTRSKTDYNSLFQAYLFLGEMLHFTPIEIEEAYVGKNVVNHQRQDQGY